jgi:hypothetical protein
MSTRAGEISVELDAIEPNQLRELEQTTIEQHLPADENEVLRIAEASERGLLTNLIRTAANTQAEGES